MLNDLIFLIPGLALAVTAVISYVYYLKNKKVSGTLKILFLIFLILFFASLLLWDVARNIDRPDWAKPIG